jgi:AcrR family transcriptional regulator
MDGFSLSDVAGRANKSRRLATHHFKTREALVEAAILELSKVPGPPVPHQPTLQTFIADVESSLRNALRVPRRRALHVVLGSIHAESSTLLAAAKAYRAAHRTMSDRPAALEEARQLRRGVDVNAQALAILALIRGATFMAFAEGESFPLDTLAQEVGASLVRSLSPDVHPTLP